MPTPDATSHRTRRFVDLRVLSSRKPRTKLKVVPSAPTEQTSDDMSTTAKTNPMNTLFMAA
ncbi:MAG: hypothetical protein AAGA08_13660 [Pseudomonadota bacterium]